jgi:hypothetical protein
MRIRPGFFLLFVLYLQKRRAYTCSMTTIEEQGEVEKTKAEQILAAEPKFPGIATMTVELGEDHTGDPAMWISFLLSQDFKPDDAWADEFSHYTTGLVIKLIHAGLRRFPHTRLAQAA